MTSPDVIVVGAGVLGLASAAELAARGAAVLVLDPGGANASSVAAGMIAPASEGLLEPPDQAEARVPLLLAARDVWPGFADRHGLTLAREGVEWRGDDPDRVRALWRAWGLRLLPGPFPTTDADWRIEAAPALEILASRSGVVRRTAVASAVRASPTGWTVETPTGGLSAPHVVVAVGAAARLAAPPALAAVLDRVAPIRGQLGFIPRPLVERMIRGSGGYLAPAEGGTVFGASMEAGRSDLTPDPVAGEAMAQACLGLIGEQRWDDVEWRVGVRGAAPDGLPLAGTAAAGLHVALAPRRNGWLMAPLVARTVADAVEGRPPLREAAVLAPMRFSPRAG